VSRDSQERPRTSWSLFLLQVRTQVPERGTAETAGTRAEDAREGKVEENRVPFLQKILFAQSIA